jgi:hypothetical protein
MVRPFSRPLPIEPLIPLIPQQDFGFIKRILR